jgi:hypothetical protein
VGLESIFAAALAVSLLHPLPEALAGDQMGVMRVDPAALALAPGAPINLELPGSETFELVVAPPAELPGRQPSLRAVPRDPALDGYLVTLTGGEETGLFGTIIAPESEYRIEPAGTSWNEVRLVALEPPSGPLCDGGLVFPATAESPHAALPAASFSPESVDGHADETVTVLNLLVLYTSSARGNLSEAQWHARLDDLLAVTNEAHAASGTQVQFQWVDARQVEASETASSFELFSRLSPVGGDFDADRYGQVEKWRLAADAHFVTLLREYQPSHGNCGAAAQPVCGDDAQCYSAMQGYSVVSLGACSALSLAHELGHNLGSAHAPGEVGFIGTFPYAFAHITPDQAGTIMSVDSARMIARFSAPELDCDGHPCGVADLRDNARSMRQARHYIARWITDQSILLFEQPPAQVTRGRGLPVNFTWFGVLTPYFDFELRRDDEPVAALATGEELRFGFKLLAIPESAALGTGYTLRVRSTDRPEVFVDSAAFELVPPTEPPSLLVFADAAVTVPAGAGMAQLTVRREGGTEGMIRVEYATQDGSAIGGVHYTPVPSDSALGWGDGSAAEYTLSIQVAAVTGRDRSFTVVLRNPSQGATLGNPSTATVTIVGTPGGGGGGGFGALGAGWLLVLLSLAWIVRARRT